MQKFKRIMVGIDFTLMDKTVVEYVALLSWYFQPEKLYFVNVQPTLDVPQSLRDAFPNFEGPRDEALKKDMELIVSTYFPNYDDFDVEFDVVEGSVRKEMLHWLHVKQVDLLVVGRKKDLKGSGIVPQQLARKSECAVLFVPEHAKAGLSHIMVPTDFSEYSRLAIDAALMFRKKDKDVTITLQHTYHVPMGFSKTGRSEEEFAEIMKKYSEERCEAFTNEYGEHDLFKYSFSYDHNRRSPAPEINDAAHKAEVDLLIMGARGRNRLTALFLGSVTEKLIQSDADIPVMVVKAKDKPFSFSNVMEYI